MRKEPNYLYMVISLLIAVVLITSAPPLKPLGILGVFTGALSLMATAYIVTERRLHVLLAAVLGAAALLPFAWFSIHPGALAPRLANGIYAANLVFWLLFTFYIVLIVFRGYLLIGVLFAQAYQLLLAGYPDALYFDPGRFSAPQMIGSGLYTRGAGDLVYYSFVTLGTVGYGDVTPSSPLARSLSLIEAVIGIMYVATMIARFVSIQISGERRGAEPEHADPRPSPDSPGNHSGVKRAAGDRVEGNEDPASTGSSGCGLR